jgi:ribonuclease HI
MGRKTQYFGVKVGRKPGVYTEWSECKAQILGVEAAKWRRFTTYEEANVYCSTDPLKIEKEG